MQVSNSSVARWKLEQNILGQADLKDLKAVEIGAKQYDKERGSFLVGTTLNGQIVLCSFDLVEYHRWKIYIWMFFRCSWSIDHFVTLNEHNRHCGCTRLVL